MLATQASDRRSPNVWEQASAVAGIVSAICAIISIAHKLRRPANPSSNDSSRSVLVDRLSSLLLASSGWTLLVLSFLWIFEPFGGYVTEAEGLQAFGVIVGFPALVLFSWGVDSLRGEKPQNSDGQQSVGDKNAP